MHSMAKMLRSFRSKMLLLFGLSMFLSGLITYLLYEGLRYYYHTMVFAGDPLARIRKWVATIGDVNAFLCIFIPLSVLFFFLLTKPYSKYFREISKGIHQLANGDFTTHIMISTNDEFKEIAEDLNQASSKLQEAVQRGDFAESSKDQLVVNLAHDLRTPLTSVLGYLDLILQDENLTKAQAKHYTTIAYTKSQRLEKLIDELFEITRMNYGMLTLEKAPLDIGELLEQLKEELYPLFEKSNLIARSTHDSSLPILGDGDLLARVFENLLVNAIRYGIDGQYVDLHGFVDAQDVVVQVTNYGNQIPEKEVPHLFEMFYSGDQARAYQDGGTGLGLFIAKNIIEQHGGTITAESSVIRTKFEVRLPLQKNLGNSI